MDLYEENTTGIIGTYERAIEIHTAYYFYVSNTVFSFKNTQTSYSITVITVNLLLFVSKKFSQASGENRHRKYFSS